MIRTTLLSFLAILFFGKMDAQVAATQAPKTLTNALLWKISGNELEHPSYLYGTIHLIAEDDFFLDKETQDAFSESQEIVFEIDLESQMNPMALMMLAPKMLMKNHSLKDLLDEADYALAKDKMAELGMPSFLFEKMKPMFVSMMLQNPEQTSPDDVNFVSYEMKFLDMAQSDEKPMSGLETAEYQMSMFDSIPLETQADILVKSLKEDTTDSGSLDDLTKMYRDRDINAMVETMDEMGGEEDFTKFLIEGRNKNWIPVMREKMSKQTTFFAVGAGHLAGKYGIIPLLRAEGYTVEPIK